MRWVRMADEDRPANVRQALMLLYTDQAAIVSAYEMADGECKVVYAMSGYQRSMWPPVVEGGIKTLRAAMMRGETIVSSTQDRQQTTKFDS